MFPVQSRRRAAQTAVPVALLLLLALVFAAAAAPQAPAAPAVVTCAPQAPVVLLGDTFSMDVVVNDVANLYALDFQMTYEADALAAVDADPNTAGIQMEVLYDFLNPGFFLRNIIDPDAGTIWYAATQINPAPPANGSGGVARLTFTAEEAGTFDLPFTSALLGDGDGSEVESVTADCRVTVIRDLEELSLYLPVILKP